MGSGVLVSGKGCFQEGSVSAPGWTGSQTGVSTRNPQCLCTQRVMPAPRMHGVGGGAQLPGLCSMLMWSAFNRMAHPQPSY